MLSLSRVKSINGPTFLYKHTLEKCYILFLCFLVHPRRLWKIPRRFYLDRMDWTVRLKWKIKKKENCILNLLNSSFGQGAMRLTWNFTMVILGSFNPHVIHDHWNPRWASQCCPAPRQPQSTPLSIFHIRRVTPSLMSVRRSDEPDSKRICFVVPG